MWAKKKEARGQKFYSSASNYVWYLDRVSYSSQSTSPVKAHILWDECFVKELLKGVILHGPRREKTWVSDKASFKPVSSATEIN